MERKKQPKVVHAASRKGGAKAVHADAGDTHVVILKDIRVFLVPDGSGWYAQALDLDYAAGGNSIEEAKEKFQIGLAETVREHLKYFGSIKKFLVPAPPDDWKEYLDAPESLNLYSTVDAFDLVKQAGETIEKEDFPFGEIKFLMRRGVLADA